MNNLTSIFRSGDVLRSRSVSAVVRTTVVDVPMPPTRLLADWQREISLQLGLEAGDIEALPLARTRLRWPEYRRCFDAVKQWLVALGLPTVLSSSEVALMASRGTTYHHDGANYGSAAFCNVFLSEDGGADIHFPAAGHRIALVRGTAVIFDPCQPHAIIKRGAPCFDEADFAPEQMRPQVFLTWELPIEHDEVKRALGITLDIAPVTPSQPQGEQVWRDGAPVKVCPQTGGWLSQP
jgi:hypothetical protein